MSPTLTERAPLRVPRKAEVVASARGWRLAVAHHEPDNRRAPKHHPLDRRACLDLLLAVKRAWWRIAFRRAAAPEARMEGLYVSSPLVEVARDLFGDHVRVLGVRLRTGRGVRAFRRGLLASMRLGRRLSAELARNAGRLAWPAQAPVAAPSRTPSPGYAVPRRRPPCLLPEPAWARPLALPHHAAAIAAPAGKVLLLSVAAREPDDGGPGPAAEAAPAGAGPGDDARRPHAA